MKRILLLALSVIMMMTCFVPNTVLADEKTAIAGSADTQSIAETYASGLIISTELTISKDGSKLILYALTDCALSVKKCGFTEIIIQRKKPTSTRWEDHKVYLDTYTDGTSLEFNKVVTLNSGYQYRATAVHYAKKSIFSTQKVSSTTGALSF